MLLLLLEREYTCTKGDKWLRQQMVLQELASAAIVSFATKQELSQAVKGGLQPMT